MGVSWWNNVSVFFAKTERLEVGLNYYDLCAEACTLHPSDFAKKALPLAEDRAKKVIEGLALDRERHIALQRIIAGGECSRCGFHPLREYPRPLLTSVDNYSSHGLCPLLT